ncbi:streptophobe family protein, partial [Streptomyces ipomoeae]|uniref:streptophobe family protein n=1 Tax=Streptomyces ipomoeae TaxID=103232 RepID=UPI003986A90A
MLPDRLGDLADANAQVGFTVDTVPTLLGALAWCLGVLLIALLASRRTPLPRGLDAVHRVVRPAVSAVVTVLLVAVLAGLAAAAYAAIGDPHPRRIAGAALLGAPNGVWLGVPIGLFVPWNGKATGALADLLPGPLDELLRIDADEPVTLGRLAELDGRIWLLGIAAALTMLYAGVLTAVRTPLGTPLGTATGTGSGSGTRSGAPSGTSGTSSGASSGTPFVRGSGAAAAGGATGADVRGGGAFRFAGRCALRLGAATAVALPVLVRATEVSVDASLAVFGIDAFGAGIELHGQTAMALVLGALWGAGAGAAGALLACASGAAGRRVAPLARGDSGATGATWAAGSAAIGETYAGASSSVPSPAGPYTPGTPYRPPNPDTNPYLRLPEELRGDGSARGPGESRPDASRPEGQRPPDVYGAPTVARRFTPPSRRPGSGSGSGSGVWPAPPPPPP